MITYVDTSALVKVVVDEARGYDAVHLAGALLIDAEIVTSADGALCEAASGPGLHIANPLDC